MELIQVLPIGAVEESLIADLCAELAAEMRARCEVLARPFDPAPARHPERPQYHSTELLARMQRLPVAGCQTPPAECRLPSNVHRFPFADTRLLGVTALDLYIPTLTFVFGEAQIAGRCAVVSVHRLRQEFYGLPPDPRMARERLLKEAVHELGHTLGLKHCDDYRCAMAPSHAVEWIDLKSSRFCPDCQARLWSAAS
jgi:archaemetzincin